MKNVAMLLSGCGVYDGSEIHETLMAMLAIDKLGGRYSLFAPDKNQFHVINHLNGEIMHESRNMLVEAARIARGKIQPLHMLDPNEFDILLFPGGFGVAKNLCNYAFKGPAMTIEEDIKNIIQQFHACLKPIGAMCIAPVLLANLIPSAFLTIGNDTETASHINQMGAVHKNKQQTEVLVDDKNRLASTPCYMLDASLSQIAQSAEKLVSVLFKMD